MVIYNPKDWWKLIFNFHKSDTFRIMLPGIIGVSLFNANSGINYLTMR
jgi:ion channel-forming bestrophin family protein